MDSDNSQGNPLDGGLGPVVLDGWNGDGAASVGSLVGDSFIVCSGGVLGAIEFPASST